ncbi:MAG TPA: ribonuclease D [Candidatus Pelagibacter bacterium]|jgi:ribonuclease D|nr:ribonuclease D [Pelagibacteraceae bacterium]HJN84432.1 ribonuclease D [Candidatus Pelagibacter bacterium]|tara:strand:+ start:77 stop:703 length:627 start_codon:yes stop_codon:yes gene_type:complete
MSTNIKLHKDDLPANLKLGSVVACDCEFTGLNPPKDKLCLIQLHSEGSKDVHIVQFINREIYKSPNLVKLLTDQGVKKIFHYARKDLQMIKWALKIDVENVECTKLQSKLARGYSSQHSYKALVQEFCGISISKAKQSSDFGKKNLDPEQLKYSSNDVLYISKIYKELNKILIREKRMELYKNALKYLKVRVNLDLAGYENIDIWSHE